MAHTIAGSNAYHAGILVPDDGDPAVAASVDTAFQMLIDNDTYAVTQLSHQAFDDRGKTSTLTGPVVINGSGAGAIDFEAPFRVGGALDAFNAVTIHSAGQFLSSATAEFRNDVTIGGSGAQGLTVNSTTDFFSHTTWHADALFGHELEVRDTFTASGDVNIGNAGTPAAIQLGNDGDNITSDADSVTVNGPVTLNNVLRVKASTHIGNSATNNHEFTGGVTFDQGIDVGGNATIEGTLTLNGSANDLGSSATVGAFSTTGNTTLGNAASDTILMNGSISAPLNFTGAGRVPWRFLRLPGVSQGVDPTMGDIFAFTDLSGSPIYAIQSANLGDHLLFFRDTTPNGHDPTVSVNSITKTFTAVGQWAEFFCLGGVLWILLRSNF